MTSGRAVAGASPAIELRSLTKRYRRGKQWFTAVNDVTLTVPAGQVIGLLGPNGAGKTTVIKMIAGLVLPSAGTVRLGGCDVARERSSAVRRIGAVLEGSRNVYWPLSPWQNLLYFGRLKGLRSGEIKPRAQRLLTELGLWERRDETVGSFSRGMQQKVAVAAALITDPPVILLDEPTIGLDVEAARTVKDWVAHLARDDGKTVVLTTHELSNAQELADRIAVIRDGSIAADLPTPQLLSRYAEDRFEVEVAGTLDGLAGELPNGVRTSAGADRTRVTLPDAGQDGLHRFLSRLRAGGIPLVSVRQAMPGLEEVFLRLIHDDGAAVTGAADTETTKEPVA